MKPSPAVQSAAAIAADHVDDILALFKPGAKVTLLVRRPEKPDGSQDFVLTTDSLDDAIKALETRRTAPTIEGTVS